MASVDVPVALLGYGTVGSAVNRLLTEQADDIERATRHRLRVVKALVRGGEEERAFPPARGALTPHFAANALAAAQAAGYAEADPTEDVSGADAAAKMAILATVAFGSRVTLADVDFEGIESVSAADVAAAREMEMVVRLVGSATLHGGRLDV